MRHPVSTPRRFEHGLKPAVGGWIVGFAIDPSAPDDTQPGAAEDAHGVRVIATPAACVRVNGGGPCAGMAGVVGQGRQGTAQPVIAGPAEGHGLVLARGVGDRSDAGLVRPG